MEKIPIRKISTPQKEPVLSESFSIRDLQDLLAGNDMVQELHRHDFYYMLVLEKGAGNHEIDFIEHKVGDHTVFLMRPGQVHQLTLKAGSTGYLLQLRSDFYCPQERELNQVLRKAGNTCLYQFDTNRFQKVRFLVTYIFQEYVDKRERYKEVIKANLCILFIELVRQHSQSRPDADSPYMQERLEQFLELIESHIATHKQVSQYADMLSLSIYQLNAITKATVGKTCSELINEYIILESKRYLLGTSNQVKEIADHLGYEDVSYFIRFFKKHTGYSPETFRHHFR